MAPLPRPKSKIPDLIYAGYEANANDWDGLGFSASQLGTECDRAIWYAFRWAPPKEKMPGRVLRLMETGAREEDRVVDNLRMAGMVVDDVDPSNGRQWTARALGGFVRGKLDGIIWSGVPESPAKPHILEIKTHGVKSFGQIKVHGVQKAKPDHYFQMLVYMGTRGIDRAIYFAVCKDTDELYVERLKFDGAAYSRLIARLQRILESDNAPAPISEKRNAPDCRFCKSKALCLGESFARVTCRSCIHSTALTHGDAAWDCSRFSKPLSADEQRAACPAHLFQPSLVPGIQVDVDEASETISYTLRDGSIWIDGQDASHEPIPNTETENAD